MGPQPFGCGRLKAQIAKASDLISFNGAATFRLRKERRRRRPPRLRRLLQWGRNLSVAEGSNPILMRGVGLLLQWGRNLSVAEGRQTTEERCRDRLLQWGRNLSVAEGTYGELKHSRTVSFNGAATFRLRKAQRGRRRRREGGASMGPQPFGCGRLPYRGDKKRAGASFNGAATFRLRKALPAPPNPIVEKASMGPQPFGCGRAAQRDLRLGRRIASMGPQPFGCGRQAPSRCFPTLPCFNGAATFRLRKVGAAMPPGPTHTQLQWGRNLSVAEGDLPST